MKFILKHFGNKKKEVFLEEGQVYFIGRQEECDFVLTEETGISRKHVKIYQAEEQGLWSVESISEWGGLYLEGEEIKAVELEQSCSLSLKNYVLEFIKEEQEELQQGEQEEENEKTEKKTISEDPQPLDLEKQALDETAEEGTKLISQERLIHTLYIFIDGEFSNHVLLDGEEDRWVIGRSEECDICIDYIILTRKQIQISNLQGRFYIKDLGSSNKTFLNDCALIPHKEVLLRADDEISVSDLKIVFEVRHKNYDKMMSNLPVIDDKESSEEENSPEIALPKVILEDVPLDNTAMNVKKQSRVQKAMIVFGLVLVLGLIFYFKQATDKKKKAAELIERQKIIEKNNKTEVFYKEALSNLEQQRYQLCIDQLEKLNQIATNGYFRDSHQVLNQCQNALSNQKQKEEFLAQEKQRKETEALIQEIVERCKTQYAKKKIRTEEDLNQCAREVVEGLDPANAQISAIRMEILEVASLKLLKQQKRDAYRKRIQQKKYYYNKAKKLRDQKKPLEAVVAYDVFLKIARGISSLKTLYDQAELERNNIQKTYDDELNQLYSSCESLIQSQKMKEAYYNCKRVLQFKSEDKKAKKYIQQAKTSLQNDLQPLYEQSTLHESMSRTEEAVVLWKQILEKDVKDGHYYKKAEFQIKKYQ